MQKLESAIRRVWEADAGVNPVLRTGLRLLSRFYEPWMRARAAFYRDGLCKTLKLPCTVISVGNLSTGGTGKTPLVLYLARQLSAGGLKVVVISRGYRSRLEAQGGIVSDGRKILVSVADSGDEPHLLAAALSGVPVVVGGDRYRAGQLAVRVFAPDVIVLDDAFQHLKLYRDINLVLVDGRRPLGNGYTLPAGELRESRQALQRGDGLVFTRCDAAVAGSPRARAARAGLTRQFQGPVFQSRHIPVVRHLVPAADAAITAQALSGRRVFAFSGLAKNDEFLYTLSDLGCEIVGSLGFGDHHDYGDHDLAAICRQAKALAADDIVTTEKDYVKIKAHSEWPVRLVVLGIDLAFGDDSRRFRRFLAEKATCNTH